MKLEASTTKLTSADVVSLVARRALTLALLAGMLTYSYHSVRKFGEGKIVASERREELAEGDALEYPCVTVCPGSREKSAAVNDSVVRERRGELISSAVKSNASMAVFLPTSNDSLWRHHVHPSEGGLCHTLLPIETEAGYNTMLVLLLEDGPHRDRASVFLHSEPGGFVYRHGDAPFLGQAKIFPEFVGAIQTYRLVRRRIKRLSTEKEECRPGTSTVEVWLDCVRRHYNCHKNTCSKSGSGSFDLMYDTPASLAATTGCPTPCEYAVHDPRKERTSSKGSSSSQGSASLIFYYEESSETVTEELEAFDSLSLLGEVGGALGLFLGWSCLNLLDGLVQWAFRIKGCAK